MNNVVIYVDGASGAVGASHAGVAAVALLPDGTFLGWHSSQLAAMTSNEAEYHAAQLGLTLAKQLQLQTVTLISDSSTVVRQMQGRSRVSSSRLQRLHRETCHAVGFFKQVRFEHVLREGNRLADALAVDAREGRVVKMRGEGRAKFRRYLLGKMIGRTPLR